MTKYTLVFLFSVSAAISAVAQTRYDSLLKAYGEGKSNLTAEDQMYLSNMSRRSKNESLANTIAVNYIATLSDEEALKPQNIRFIIGNTGNTSDRGFKLYGLYPLQIDSAIKDPGFAEKTMSAIIIKDEKLLDVTSPNWKSSYKLLTRKYNKVVAERTISLAKIKFYKYQKDSSNYANAITSFVNRYRLNISNIEVNNYGYEIFLYSNDQSCLNSAINWFQPIVDNPSSSYLFIDTYANLLYKANRANDAIQWEQKALAIAPKDMDVKDALEKMQKGEKTW